MGQGLKFSKKASKNFTTFFLLPAHSATSSFISQLKHYVVGLQKNENDKPVL